MGGHHTSKAKRAALYELRVCVKKQKENVSLNMRESEKERDTETEKPVSQFFL